LMYIGVVIISNICVIWSVQQELHKKIKNKH
jgi:hypothetical protein